MFGLLVVFGFVLYVWSINPFTGDFFFSIDLNVFKNS